MANFSPNFKLPDIKFSFRLDKEERELVANGANMEKEKIWDLLEKKRFEEL